MAKLENIKTGIPKLDNEIGGSFPKKTSLLILSPIDPEFDLYFSDIIEYSIKEKNNCICISLLFPEELQKFIDSPNFHLICGELGTFSEYKGKKNIKLVDTDIEGIVAGFEEIYESLPDDRPIITLIKVSSIQFYHGLAPTNTILGMLIELFKKLDISLSVAYLEVDERSAPVLESFEEKFDGCIHFLHGSVGADVHKFFYIKKLKGISTPFELVHVTKNAPKKPKKVLKESEVKEKKPEGMAVKEAVKEIETEVKKSTEEIIKKEPAKIKPSAKKVEPTKTKPIAQKSETKEIKSTVQKMEPKQIKPQQNKPTVQKVEPKEVKPAVQKMEPKQIKPTQAKPTIQKMKPKQMKSPPTKPNIQKPKTSTPKKSVADNFSLFKLNDLIDKHWEDIEATAKKNNIPSNILTDFGWTYAKNSEGKVVLKIDEYGKPSDAERKHAKKISKIINAFIKKETDKEE